MKQDVFYCKSWFRAKNKPIDIWLEKKAYKKHIAGESYTALIGSDSTPSCFIEVIKDKGWVGVSFLNDKLQEYLLYNFKILGDDRLFLSMAIYREFAERDGEGVGILNVSHGTTYIFNEDGSTVVREEQFHPYKLKESLTTVDVAGNYDTFPDFGEYDSLIRKER
ncbi:hypothetical protein [Kosakonia sacchari]|uniref:hypothetical protein n=1 Tax=Kosakonia sacchari TaxID=1158459 RepID=UPI003F579590